MKKFLIPAFAAILLSCNSETKDAKTSDETKVEPATENLMYAYTLKDHPSDNWDRGDQKNVVMVLNSLKAFENNKLGDAFADFADSIQLSFDELEAKLSKDSTLKMFQAQRDNMKSYSIDMEDYETVISKDKKSEWVSLWYKEKWTDNQGKTDSIFHMDDVKIVNGKIALIDQKSRRYMKKKA
jgi:superfamily I DNA/RNA helicase